MPPWRKLMNLASVLTLVSWSLSWLQLFVHLSSLPGLRGFLSSHPESLFCDAHASHYFCCFHLWILSTLGFKAILSLMASNLCPFSELFSDSSSSVFQTFDLTCRIPFGWSQRCECCQPFHSFLTVVTMVSTDFISRASFSSLLLSYFF